jgi:hypothetical protein
MAKKISELTQCNAEQLTNGDELVIVNGGETKCISLSSLKDWINSEKTLVGVTPIINSSLEIVGVRLEWSDGTTDNRVATIRYLAVGFLTGDGTSVQYEVAYQPTIQDIERGIIFIDMEVERLEWYNPSIEEWLDTGISVSGSSGTILRSAFPVEYNNEDLVRFIFSSSTTASGEEEAGQASQITWIGDK